jgi:hypothetical protein
MLKIQGLRGWLGPLFSLMAFGLIAGPANAALAPLQVKPGKVNSPIRAGALAGGQAGDEFSILAIERSAGEGDREKLVISYGDRFGKPIQGETGFFHVALDRGSRRVVIDLAQVSRTAVDQADLTRILASSRFISSSDMTMDPQDGSTNITLNLRSPAQLTVQAERGERGRLIIELSGLPGATPSLASGELPGRLSAGVK